MGEVWAVARACQWSVDNSEVTTNDQNAHDSSLARPFTGPEVAAGSAAARIVDAAAEVSLQEQWERLARLIQRYQFEYYIQGNHLSLMQIMMRCLRNWSLLRSS